MTLRILVVDNYDSFVYNLVQYLAQLGADSVVRRNDEVRPGDLDGIDGVLTSPGPSTPERGRGQRADRAATAPGGTCRCSASASGTRRSGWPSGRP